MYIIGISSSTEIPKGSRQSTICDVNLNGTISGIASTSVAVLFREIIKLQFLVNLHLLIYIFLMFNCYLKLIIITQKHGQNQFQ